MALDRPFLDLRTLPGTSESMVYKDGGLFPVLALVGEKVVAVLRGGAGHLGLAGRIEVTRSGDGGRTWSPPAVIADSAADDRNPALGVSSGGTLVLAYHRQGNYDDAGNWRPLAAREESRVEVRVTRSHDGGVTWEKPFPLGIEALQAGSPFGKIVPLADGTLLMPIYGRPVPGLLGNPTPEIPAGGDCSYLVRSRDDGATWGEPSLIGADMNETALIALPDGDVVAVMRGVPPDQALHCTRSADGGWSWSPPVQVTGVRQHPADLVQLADGAILMTYGNRMPPYRIEGRVSSDGGRSWAGPLLALSGPLYGYDLPGERPTDLGYPSSVVQRGAGGGTGVTIYYYNPAVNTAWRQQDRRNEPRYRVRNYCAVALRWDEVELLEAIAGTQA